jgi:hypothetical protein
MTRRSKDSRLRSHWVRRTDAGPPDAALSTKLSTAISTGQCTGRPSYPRHRERSPKDVAGVYRHHSGLRYTNIERQSLWPSADCLPPLRAVRGTPGIRRSQRAQSASLGRGARRGRLPATRTMIAPQLVGQRTPVARPKRPRHRLRHQVTGYPQQDAMRKDALRRLGRS